VPSWDEFHGMLPLVFAGSAIVAGAGCLALAPLAESAPARKMAITGAALELAAIRRVEAAVGRPLTSRRSFYRARAGLRAATSEWPSPIRSTDLSGQDI
jgi:hypothetical protein